MRGNNFLTTMLRLFQERDEIKVVDDQVGAPTWSRMVAEGSVIIIGQVLNQRSEDFQWGLYHLAASGETTWFRFVQAIMEAMQSPHSFADSKSKLPTILPISSNEYPSPVERPKYSLLSTKKVSETFGVSLTKWKEQLDLMDFRF